MRVSTIVLLAAALDEPAVQNRHQQSHLQSSAVMVLRVRWRAC